MSPDHALQLLADLLLTAMLVCAPLLGLTLLAGLVVSVPPSPFRGVFGHERLTQVLWTCSSRSINCDKSVKQLFGSALLMIGDFRHSACLIAVHQSLPWVDLGHRRWDQAGRVSGGAPSLSE